jgi:hypothetical protein
MVYRTMGGGARDESMASEKKPTGDATRRGIPNHGVVLCMGDLAVN